ncbi:MAG: NFYB/HAP3 family transcription factor subunit [Candidatus Aenigmatarchaeota archaeon]
MDMPLSPVERILKRSSMRVSDDAVKEFASLLEEIAADIAAEAAANAKRANRKTVNVSDIEAAKRKLLQL